MPSPAVAALLENEKNHNPVLRNCYGSDGISQPDVNVINRDLPGTRVARSQCNPCRMNQKVPSK